MTKRLIPVVQLDMNWRAVKTVRFGKRTYVGDPLNILCIYDEFDVDEVVILDIDATRYGYRPRFDRIKGLISKLFMPVSYGGGISSLEDCVELNRIGVDKFVIGAAQFDYEFVSRIAVRFGSQAVVCCVDVEYVNGSYAIRGKSHINLVSHIEILVSIGIGEIILQSADRDGERSGYDLNLISYLSKVVTVPMVALGGAKSELDCNAALEAGADAAASGSAFCFYGRHKAVLINYPSLR